MNEFPYSLDDKRYHTLNYFYKQKFGKKVFKVSLNAGFSCPNYEKNMGCIYCSHQSGDFAGKKEDDLKTQFQQVKTMMEHKWKDSYYIGYFQAGSNTYAPLEVLKQKFEEVLSIDNVIGLSIATRSDCFTEEIYNYLEELNQRTFLTIELGLQSMHEQTLKFIHRGHTLQNFEECVKQLQKRHIPVVVHIINGLPNETKDMMIETVKYLNKLHIDGIKIHMLHILKNTPLANTYQQYHLLSKEEYIDIVCEQLANLDPTIVIHRITGDPNQEDLIEPTWLVKKFCVLNDIDKEMKARNLYQGSYLHQ